MAAQPDEAAGVTETVVVVPAVALVAQMEARADP